MIRGGDFSMLKVWAGLEARSFLQASIESVSVDRGLELMCSATDTREQVEACVKYDQLSPNV